MPRSRAQPDTPTEHKPGCNTASLIQQTRVANATGSCRSGTPPSAPDSGLEYAIWVVGLPTSLTLEKVMQPPRALRRWIHFF